MSFGWSAGDIVAGLSTIAKVVKSLKESGGAATEYQEAITFLDSISKTLLRIQSLLQDNPNLRWEADLVEQGDTLKSAVEDFEKEIKKYDKSLGSETQRGKAIRIPREVQFALFCSDKIKELRTAVTQPQLILDVFINLQTLTSILDVSRTASMSEAKLELLTQKVSQLTTITAARANALDQAANSQSQDVKELQEASETRIRDDLEGIKSYLQELGMLHSSTAGHNRANNQTLLEHQMKLMSTVHAVYDHLQTQLDYLLQRKVDEPNSQGSRSTPTSSQMLLGIAQVIGSGIASGLGAMVALSSRLSTPGVLGIEGRGTLPRAPLTTSPLYEDAWENAFRAAENQHTKNASLGQSKALDSTSAPATSSIAINREQKSLSQKKRQESRVASSALRESKDIDPEFILHQVPAYHLDMESLVNFLEGLFGKYDFKVYIQNDRWTFQVPRKLTSREESSLPALRFIDVSDSDTDTSFNKKPSP